MEQTKRTGYPSIDKPWLKYYKVEDIMKPFPKKTILEYIEMQNCDHLEDTALIYFGRKFSYNQLFRIINQTAAGFISIGVKPGDIISVCAPAIPEAVFVYYALSRIGAVSNMIDPRTSEEGIRKYIDETSSKIIVSVDLFMPKIQRILSVTNVNTIITVSPSCSFPNMLKILYNLKNRRKKAFLEVPKSVARYDWSTFLCRGRNRKTSIDYSYKENVPVTILHTGGTTGTPKGVMLSNDNLNALAHQELYANIGFKRGDRWLNIMPPFIAYGVGNALHVPLAIGMQSTLIPSFDANRFAELILKYKPTHIAGVPLYWDNVIHSSRMRGKDLSFLQSAGVGGDSMSRKLEKDVIVFFASHNSAARINKGYGMTELSSAVCACNLDANEIGSVGIPFIGNTISVFEPGTDTELQYNQYGEICISGPTVMLGYYNNPAEDERVLLQHADGKRWIHSRDIGYMTESGLVYICDRMKRMIIRPDGFKVYPTIIENVIAKHSAVEACAVIGVPCAGFAQGMAPKAFVVLKKRMAEQSDTMLAEIDALCKKELAEYALPAEYELIDRLPLTPIGKIDYRALERACAADHTGA